MIDESLAVTPQEKVRESGLAGLLRIGGAMVVVAAMCSLLLEGWQQWSDVSRYYAMLGGTAVLSVCGFLMSYWLKENKSARVFFGLGLLSVVANATTLGGLLHSAMPWDEAQIQSFAWADWSAGDSVSLATLIITAIAILLPLSWFSFKIFARDHATGLLTTFAVANSLILVPVRESLPVGLLIAAAVAIPCLYWRNAATGKIEFQTAEGRFALAALFAPAAIMLARLLWLYEADTVILWILTTIALTGNRYLGHLIPGTSAWRHANSALYVLLALALGGFSVSLLEAYVPRDSYLPLFGIIAGLVIWHKGRDYRDGESAGQTVFTVIGCGLMLLTALVNLLGHDTISASVIGAGVGAMVAIFGHREGNVAMTTGGIGTILIALIPRAWDLLALIDFTHWGTLAGIGITTIVAGAAIERRRNRRMERLATDADTAADSDTPSR